MYSNNNLIDQAYNKYFGTDATKPQNSSVIEKGGVLKQAEIPRLTASKNIDNLDQLGEIIRKLLNAAWGSNWGVISPETSKGEDAETIILPQINYSMNLREIADGTNPKPQLFDTITEIVDGKHTGDSFRLYRQFFDCIVEFDFYDNTSLGCRNLMHKFEELIATYTGYLKDSGISEMFFLKEVPSKYSLNYVEGVPMKCLYFFVRLERIKQVRVSTIMQVEQRLLHKQSLVKRQEDKNQKITYKL